MILSPRHNPLNLSVNVHGRDSESSSLRSRPNSPRPRSPLPQSKQPLLSDTPLASPYILPRRGKKIPYRFSLCRIFLYFVASLIVFVGGISLFLGGRGSGSVSYTSEDGKTYEMLGQDELPDYATPIVVADKKGRPKWTVSIPPSKDFPLTPAEYKQICSTTQDVAKHVEDVKNGNNSPDHNHKSNEAYYYNDPYYMDIDEAQSQGVLPGGASNGRHDISSAMIASDKTVESMVGTSNLLGDTGKICSKSLTFVMESEDAGLGNTLMHLWTAYGLALLEDRAFFIDDSNWAYGSYATYFQPPPRPSCLPPPKTQITPCPHQTRHFLVSTATTPWTFGNAFNAEFMDKGAQDVFRLETIFRLARSGYEALFDLSSADASYLASHLDHLNTTIRGSPSAPGIEIAIHVRHGDRHPLEPQYRESYLPLSKYSDAARSLLYTHFTDDRTGAEDFPAEMASKFLIASDDPDVYSSAEMSHALRAQTSISMASQSAQSKSSSVSGVDDRVGWEGGFFTSLFWSLGRQDSAISVPADSPAPSYSRRYGHKANAYLPTTSPSSSSTSTTTSSSTSSSSMRDPHHTSPTPQALHLRELVARAYLLDIAVLGQADAVVCGVSSMTCRLLAVMMGWEAAIGRPGMEEAKWINVDGWAEWWGIGY